MESADHRADSSPRKRGGVILVLSPLLCFAACASPPPERILPGFDRNAPLPDKTRRRPAQSEGLKAGDTLELRVRRSLRLTAKKARAKLTLPLIARSGGQWQIKATITRMAVDVPWKLRAELPGFPGSSYQVERLGNGGLKIENANGGVAEPRAREALMELGALCYARGLWRQGPFGLEERSLNPKSLRPILGPGLECRSAVVSLIGPETAQDRPVDVFRLKVQARSTRIGEATLTLTGRARYAMDDGRLLSLELSGSEPVDGPSLLYAPLPYLSGFQAKLPQADRICGELSFSYALEVRAGSPAKR